MHRLMSRVDEAGRDDCQCDVRVDDRSATSLRCSTMTGRVDTRQSGSAQGGWHRNGSLFCMTTRHRVAGPTAAPRHLAIPSRDFGRGDEASGDLLEDFGRGMRRGSAEVVEVRQRGATRPLPKCAPARPGVGLR